MKKTTLAVALLLVGASVFATEKNNDKPVKPSKEVAVISNAPQKYKLVYFGKDQGKVDVTLRNADGDVIHHSKVKNSEGFAQPYDLNELPAGDYTFEVIKPDGSSIEETITLRKPEVKINFNANLLNVNDGKKFRLAVVNKDKEPQTTTIDVYDGNNTLVHSEKIENLYAFRKVFDLSDLPGDTFKFAISNATGTRYLSAK